MKISISLSPGVWEYWFFNSKTNKPLTDNTIYLGRFIKAFTDVIIEIPKYIEETPEAVIRIQRVR